MVEALLAYWLSWFVLPSGLEDGLNDYVIPLAILLAKGEKLALALLYMRSLYARFDECVKSMICSMSRYLW